MARTEHEITTDGRTVWVNSPEVCLARFGPGVMDVHAPAETQLVEGVSCLDCQPVERVYEDLAEGCAVWDSFRESVRENHGIEVPSDLRPSWCGGPPQ